MTVEQYDRFEGYPGIRDELINGEIVFSPHPKPLHQQITENVHLLLRSALSGRGFTAKQYTNIRFVEASSMPAPDVFVISKMAWKKACEENDYLSELPILVVEVLSPANRKQRVEAKVALYLNQAVKEVWLIRPKKRTLEVIRKKERAFATGSVTLPKPLVGQVDVNRLFQIDE